LSAGCVCVCVCMWVSVVLAVEIVRTAVAMIWMRIQSEIMACLQGSRASWKVLECFDKISRNWKIILVRKFKLKVPGICWDVDARMRTRQYSRLHTSSVCDSFLQ